MPVLSLGVLMRLELYLSSTFTAAARVIVAWRGFGLMGLLVAWACDDLAIHNAHVRG